MVLFRVALVLGLACLLPSLAQAKGLDGVWGSKLGTIRVKVQGDKAVGTMVRATKLCPYKSGEKVMDGVVMEDSFTGKVKLCQLDDDCGGPVWAYAVLLIGGDTLSGSVHSKEAMCPLVGTNAGKGLYLKRSKKAKIRKKRRVKATGQASAQKEVDDEEEVIPGPPAKPGTYDPRAAFAQKSKSTPVRDALKRGESLLHAGQFERARKGFKKALKYDATNPLALTGIGATYYARNDYAQALVWYKKALESDPNFGMAYYNIACVYALRSNPKMALKYLKIALMNGFVVQATMNKDPDLKSLHGNEEFEKLLRGEW